MYNNNIIKFRFLAINNLGFGTFVLLNRFGYIVLAFNKQYYQNRYFNYNNG